MAHFQKKPVVVEAEQFLGSAGPLPFNDRAAIVCLSSDGRWYVTTIHGQETDIAVGDWIILEPDGRHAYPCKPDIFEARYEAVRPAPTGEEEGEGDGGA